MSEKPHVELDLMDAMYGTGDSEQVTLPSGRTATVHEMTGLEQRNFMNKAKLNNGMAIQELLAACTDSIDGEELPTDKRERIKVVTDLLAGDRQALLFAIRRFSLGDEFQFKIKCPQCEKEGDWEVNLSDKDEMGNPVFPVVPYPNGNQRTYEYASQKVQGLRFRVTLLDGNAEMRVLRNRANADILSDLEARMPHSWDPNNNRWVPVNMSRLKDNLISEMRREIQAQEGYVEDKVKIVCENCSDEVEFHLLQIPDFTIPSVIS